MRLIKRLTAIFIIAVFVLALIPRISDAAVINISLSQSEFSGGELTDVTIALRNDSTEPMTNISVSAEGQTYNYDKTIEPGDTLELIVPNFLVTAEMVNTDVEFVIKWTEGSYPMSASQSVFIRDANSQIPSLQPEEQIEFTCYCDNPQAERGDIIEISYTVTNNSELKMTDITITDKNVSDKPIVSGKSVSAGDSATFTYDFTMGSENVTASPIMSYYFENDDNIKSLQGNSVTLENVSVNMDVNIAQLEATEKGTEFLIKIANNGNKSIKSIRVYQGLEATDETKIQHAFDLGIGESREISYIEKSKGKSEVTFIITGQLVTGEPYEFKSETYTVWEYINGTVDMSIEAEVESAIDADGYVSIDFIAKNLGTVDMSSLVLSEEHMGKIGSFSDLAGGGEEKIGLTLYVGEAREMKFTLTGIAPTGQPFEYTVTISAQLVSSGSNDTTISAFDAVNIDVGSAVSKILQKILAALAVISGIFGVALVVLSVFEFQYNIEMRKKKKQAE